MGSVIIVQVWGKYMMIGYLDPKGALLQHRSVMSAFVRGWPWTRISKKTSASIELYCFGGLGFRV